MPHISYMRIITFGCHFSALRSCTHGCSKLDISSPVKPWPFATWHCSYLLHLAKPGDVALKMLVGADLVEFADHLGVLVAASSIRLCPRNSHPLPNLVSRHHRHRPPSCRRLPSSVGFGMILRVVVGMRGSRGRVG